VWGQAGKHTNLLPFPASQWIVSVHALYCFLALLFIRIVLLRLHERNLAVGVDLNSVRLNFCMAVALSDASGQYERSIQLPWPIH